ncbi:MAG: hypothetical protein K2L07_04055 [Lachnospiraceae bacterium]|nr:hypothetical protein [Lachnospiraceae bacterium]
MKKGFGVSLAAGFIGGVAIMGIAVKKLAETANKDVDKFRGYYNMLNQWMAIKQEGRSLEEYFIRNGYKTIAIYGMGGMGSRLYEDLKQTNIEVRYAIDQNAVCTDPELKMITIDDEIETVDVIVVTATFAYDEIKELLSKKTKTTVISLEEVVFEI